MGPKSMALRLRLRALNSGIKPGTIKEPTITDKIFLNVKQANYQDKVTNTKAATESLAAKMAQQARIDKLNMLDSDNVSYHC